jgi:probable rRNA maturation factor
MRKAAPRIRLRDDVHHPELAMARLRRALRILLATLDRHGCELSVYFCDEATIRLLNRDWRGFDRSTDVLSFSQLEGETPPGQPGILGDVVIAVPVAERRARRDGRPVEEEVLRLLVHGLLHLEGHDHQRPAETARMRGLEDEMLKMLVAKLRA